MSDPRQYVIKESILGKQNHAVTKRKEKKSNAATNTDQDSSSGRHDY